MTMRSEAEELEKLSCDFSYDLKQEKKIEVVEPGETDD